MLNPSLPYAQLSDDYRRVEQAIRFLEANYLDQPELEEVAASIGLSEYHFQRLFTRWVGISPKRFLQYLTKEHAKHLLRRSGDLLEAAYASGLSGPGRLHDLFVSTEAVTPGEYKQAGAGLEIRYGFHPTPFGMCLIALTQRGVCGLSFVEPGAQDFALAQMRSRWRNAAFIHDEAARSRWWRKSSARPGSLPAQWRSTSTGLTSRSRSGRRSCASPAARW